MLENLGSTVPEPLCSIRDGTIEPVAKSIASIMYLYAKQRTSVHLVD